MSSRNDLKYTRELREKLSGRAHVWLCEALGLMPSTTVNKVYMVRCIG
jgi:hypothetical protein